MLKSALDYFGGTNASNLVDHGSNINAIDDPLVGSVVDVGGVKVAVKRRIGEGGFAFVYEVVDIETRQKQYALKRLLAVDKEKRAAIVKEISILKTFSSHSRIVTFNTSASGNRPVGGGRSIEEFLVLMEYCPAVLSDVLRCRSLPFPPDTVARIFTQVMDAVATLHGSNPPLIHRDLKLENLLINSFHNGIKLCDFGSATSETFHPNIDWTMNQRTTLEEETAKHTTPMYRAPEMLDTWSNYAVDARADIWACGCLLFVLCFHYHPFEDSAKLAIINGNFKIPPGDTAYIMFHDLIRQMLTVDPSLRPDANQVLQHLTGVALSNGIDPTTEINFELASPISPVESINSQMNLSNIAVTENVSPNKNTQLNSHTAQSGSGLMGSLKGGAGSIMKNIRDKSHSVIQTVQHSMATKELDLHCVTERLAAMSYPADGIESAFKNHIDDVSATIESKHSNKEFMQNDLFEDENNNCISSNAVNTYNLIDLSLEEHSTYHPSNSTERKLKWEIDLLGNDCENIDSGFLNYDIPNNKKTNCKKNESAISENNHKRYQNKMSNLTGEFNSSVKCLTSSGELIDKLLDELDSEMRATSNASSDQCINKSSSLKSQCPGARNKISLQDASKDPFGDLLQSFEIKFNNRSIVKETIGEMKINDDIKKVSPLQAKILKWKNGKSRNLRALLCSLDSILWEGTRWKKCGMHQLVSEIDVKHFYKTACRAVHPDKNRGTENEDLANLVQIELNDAWAEYKKGLPLI